MLSLVHLSIHLLHSLYCIVLYCYDFKLKRLNSGSRDVMLLRYSPGDDDDDDKCIT